MTNDAKLDLILKQVGELKTSHEVAVTKNEEQHKALNATVSALKDNIGKQNGRVTQTEKDTKENAIAIAGIKGSARAWSIGAPLAITIIGLIISSVV